MASQEEGNVLHNEQGRTGGLGKTRFFFSTGTFRFAEVILAADIKQLQLTWERARLEMLLSSEMDASGPDS